MLMKNLKKSSFTLIELIVAIIVIGVVVTSIPMLLATSSNVLETNQKEKSFFNAYALLNLLQTEEWDENNTAGDNYYKVLTSDGGDSELNCTRSGVVQLDNDSGAVCASDNNKTSAIGVDSGEDDVSKYDDIDDFNGFSLKVSDFNMSVSVRYMVDSADYTAKHIFFNENNSPTNSANLKFVEVNVSNKDTHELIAVIKYISSNIGMTKIESRNE